MKTRILSIPFILFLLSNSGVIAQWVRLESPTISSFIDMEIIDETNGFLLTSAQLWKTEDGGNTFQDVTPPGHATFIHIQFVDAQVGFVLCNNSVLYRTTNGGKSYDKTEFNVPHFGTQVAPARDIVFRDSLNGFCTSDHQYYRTEDGGESWEQYQQDNNYEPSMTRDHFNPDTHATYCIKTVHDVTGYYMSYVEQYCPVWDAWGCVADALDYISVSAVAYYQDSIFMYARDDENNIYTYDYHTHVLAAQVRCILQETYVIQDMYFPDEKNGFMCGRSVVGNNSTGGILLHSEDSGRTWQTDIEDPDIFSFNALSFPTQHIGYAVGDYGTLWKWSDQVIEEASDGPALFPNPGTGWVSIYWPAMPEDPGIVVFDILGRIVSVPYTITGHTILLDAHALIEGTYVIKLSSAGREIASFKSMIL